MPGLIFCFVVHRTALDSLDLTPAPCRKTRWEATQLGGGGGSKVLCDDTEKKDTLQALYGHLESFRFHKYTFKPFQQVKN